MPFHCFAFVLLHNQQKQQQVITNQRQALTYSPTPVLGQTPQILIIFQHQVIQILIQEPQEVEQKTIVLLPIIMEQVKTFLPDQEEANLIPIAMVIKFMFQKEVVINIMATTTPQILI